MTAPTLRDFWTLRYSAGGHLLTRLLSQRIGAVIAWCGLRLGMSPNVITLLGSVVFLLASLALALLPTGLVWALVCAAMLQFGYGVDCADGQLARGTGRSSGFGAWLDVACDYVRNIMLAAGLALWLSAQLGSVALALSATALFCVGTAVQLHTVTVLRQNQPGNRIHARGWMARLRDGVTAALDTATVLLVMALLRDRPVALAVYLAGVGVLYLAMATFLATRRLRNARA